ncbi:hypothetical protein AXF42_Ash003533 [Apostasia shenzhenica]|uniref:Uncharacterized protein n=1 Tax=Apostasia shenzhenica TaxID=1088818 RepID=A0A2I0BGH0_9ASPA|nr:hypothetical protein AXF42_Ash003533 [Apostasia shenzhenica]
MFLLARRSKEVNNGKDVKFDIGIPLRVVIVVFFSQFSQPFSFRNPSISEMEEGSNGDHGTVSAAGRTHGYWFSNLFKLRQAVDEREEISLSVSSPAGTQSRFPAKFTRDINWVSLIELCHEWIKHPKNIALLIWFICVAISSAMLGLLLLGILNREFPAKSFRSRWIEINNQFLNALFTLMSIYQHPSLFHHLVLLLQWRPEDIVELRKVYCKNRAHRPRERAHISVVVFLLHVTCFSQYVLCGLYWGYTLATRPQFLESFFSAIGIAAPLLASGYAIYSPLGKEPIPDSEEEESVDVEKQSSESGRVALQSAEWAGKLFDCREDVSVCWISFFFPFCVFGWNMERLGFGNMYVHIATFFLLCFAPLWIFSISAQHINNEAIRDAVAVAGLVLSFFGLLYGGYWRIQVRRRLKLPGSKLLCCSESTTDYVHWLFCWGCSLAQEVRTGDLYEVEDGKLYREEEKKKKKKADGEEERCMFLSPLPSEWESSLTSGAEYSSMESISWKVKMGSCYEEDEEEERAQQCRWSMGGSPMAQQPPFQQFIQLEKVRRQASEFEII